MEEFHDVHCYYSRPRSEWSSLAPQTSLKSDRSFCDPWTAKELLIKPSLQLPRGVYGCVGKMEGMGRRWRKFRAGSQLGEGKEGLNIKE